MQTQTLRRQHILTGERQANLRVRLDIGHIPHCPSSPTAHDQRTDSLEEHRRNLALALRTFIHKHNNLTAACSLCRFDDQLTAALLCLLRRTDIGAVHTRHTNPSHGALCRKLRGQIPRDHISLATGIYNPLLSVPHNR